MPKIEARQILWWLVFVGFSVNYMIRINLNITIVDMVKHKKKTSSGTIVSYCGSAALSEMVKTEKTTIPHDQITALMTTVRDANHPTEQYQWDNDIMYSENSIINRSVYKAINRTSYREIRSNNNTIDVSSPIKSIEQFVLDSLNVDYEKDGFDWNAQEQGAVLGSFFWIHWVTQIPGGILARKYGTKLIFGVSNVVGCWICFIIPILSYLDYKWVIFIRVIQGLICGLSWPAMHNMTAQWIPPNERSKFVTAYLGSSVGISLFYPLFGYMQSYLSWEYVFHFCGIFGTVWWIFWNLLAYDSPAQHPWITEEERNRIEKSLGVTDGKPAITSPTPWKAMFTSVTVWCIVAAQWGGIWGLFTLMTQAPTYFKVIHGWNTSMTGLLSGFPHMMRFLFGLGFSTFGDYLLKSGKISRTNVRKLATSLCTIVKGFFVFLLAFSGCNSTAAIVCLTLALTFHGSVSTGPLASIVDISPNYASIILGLSGMIGVMPGFISAAIVGAITHENQTITSWKYVFLISAAMLIISGILYDLFADSNVQSWNSPNALGDKEMSLIVNNLSKDKLESENIENSSRRNEEEVLVKENER